MNTNRIKLINCDEKILELVLGGNEILSQGLNLNVPEKWTEFGDPIFKYSLERVREQPGSSVWWSYLPVIVNTNTLIGSCGYKGEPNEKGMVEIGYEVAAEFRNQGFATEIANLLIDRAFKNDNVKLVQAHTLASENASVNVLKKCNFEFVEELEDEEDGKIWKWQLKRN